MRVRLIIWLTVAICAVPRAYALAEVTLGVPEADSLTTCVGPSALAVYQFRAGCREWITRSGRRVLMRYNKLGLRDRDYPSSPAMGARRILFLGSSELVAPGLDEALSPVRLLEGQLRKRDPRVEVVNGGVEGYTAIQAAIAAREWMRALRPTHVIYKISNGAASLMGELQRPFYVGGASNAERVDFQLTRYFPQGRALHFLRRNIGDAHLFAFVISWERLKLSWQCRLKGGAERAECITQSTRSAIGALSREAKAVGADFLVILEDGVNNNRLVLNPWLPPRIPRLLNFFTPEIRYENSYVAAALEREGVKVVRLPEMVSAERRASFLLPNSLHFNELGSLTLAQACFVALDPLLKR